MIQYWYRRILIIVVVFTTIVGGSCYVIAEKKSSLRQEVSAGTGGETLVIPGGMPVGIYLETNGVMVLGTESVTGMDGMAHDPAAHLVRSGDYIIAINGKKIETKTQLIEEVERLEKREVVLTVKRNETRLDLKFQPVQYKEGKYRLGIWVRDNTQGLGTVTYLNADSEFGALGHGIHDVDTNELLDISDGTLYLTSIRDIQKGVRGTPGGIEGIIVYNNYNVLGTITENTEAGLFGKLDRIDALFTEQEPVRTAGKEAIRAGDAVIRCSVEGEVKDYKIKITDVDLRTDEINKGIVLEVTDERLLEKTGGIIQGMSGSPILQDGKLIGAVTHVFVNDPKKGYGIFIENMLEHEVRAEQSYK